MEGSSEKKELSIEYKEKGNEEFKKENYKEALNFFNKAIVISSILYLCINILIIRLSILIL